MADPAEWARRAQSGDREAFGTLVEAHWERLVRLARSIVGETDAEDVVQDGLIAAWRALPSLSKPESVTSWLSRIVFRRCLRRARTTALRRTLTWIITTVANPDPCSEITLERLLDRLSARQRAVMHLSIVEEMSDSEIAASLGIAASSVRVHRLRARKVLQRHWQQERS